MRLEYCYFAGHTVCVCDLTIPTDISRVEGIKWIGGVTPEAWETASSAAHVQAELLTLLRGVACSL